MVDKKNNTGDRNTGIRNTGYRNTGDWNTGHWNTGDRNTGDRNTGIRNTGYCNTGDSNTGYSNTGYCNTGSRNTGYCNTGDWNTGDRNTGSRNTGGYNKSDRNTGYFNTTEPTIRMFNKDTGLKRDDIYIPFIDLKITEWIPESQMSEQQKKQNPDYKTTGGFLLKRSYKEAWRLAWSKMSEMKKNQFKNLPNFDPDIFEEITGIRVDSEDSCDGKVVEIDGKKYELKEVFE